MALVRPQAASGYRGSLYDGVGFPLPPCLSLVRQLDEQFDSTFKLKRSKPVEPLRLWWFVHSCNSHVLCRTLMPTVQQITSNTWTSSDGLVNCKVTHASGCVLYCLSQHLAQLLHFRQAQPGSPGRCAQ